MTNDAAVEPAETEGVEGLPDAVTEDEADEAPYTHEGVEDPAAGRGIVPPYVGPTSQSPDDYDDIEDNR